MDNVKDNEIDSIREQLLHPENYILGRNTRRYEEYVKGWIGCKSIISLLHTEDIYYFLYNFHDDLYDKLNQYALTDFSKYIDIIEQIETPYLLKDILRLSLSFKEDCGKYLELLRKAKSTRSNRELSNDDGYLDDNIDSIVAPVVLDVIIWNISQKSDIHDQIDTDNEGVKADRDSNEWKMELLSEVCGVLSERDDGLYLVYYMIRHMLIRERTNDEYYQVLDSLSDALSDRATKYFVRGDHIYVRGLKKDYDADDFKKTGKLEETSLLEGGYEADLLLNFRTILWLIGVKGNEKPLFETFKKVYSYQAISFHTMDIKFCLKHFDISRILLERGADYSWKNIKVYSSSAIQRVSQVYFGDHQRALWSHFMFMNDVSLRMLDYLCENDKTQAEKMLQIFWKDGLEHARRFARFHDECQRNYLAALICYYYACFVRDGKDIKDLMGFFHEIKEMPVLVVTAISMLIKNGASWEELLECDKDYFINAIRRAETIAEGQRQYRWIGSFLKKLS